MKIYICPLCDGDGKETCSNPDHGFIGALTFTEIGRLGCPCCGHDEDHKVPNGGICEICQGVGTVTQIEFDVFCEDYDFDIKPKPI